MGFVMMTTYQLKEVSTRFMGSTAAQKTTIIILDVVTQVIELARLSLSGTNILIR